VGNFDVSGLVRTAIMTDRLLVLSRYSRLGASSRLRTMQYKPWLEDAGFEVEYSELFDDNYLKRLYSEQGSKIDFFKYYLKRIIQLIRSAQFDLIWIEYESLPWLPWLIERYLLPTSIPIISDYDDAIFHRYDNHYSIFVKMFFGQKINNIMRHSKLVTVGNEYLANYARSVCAESVVIIPTVVDLSQYSLNHELHKRPLVNIGWIGTPNTWSTYGKEKYDLLQETLINNNATFTAVGAQLEANMLGILELIPWSEDIEVNAIQDMDIGIMPLNNTPWSKGKCGYKLIQYMACSLPVVASPIGVNKIIVEHGVNGFLAETDEDWLFYTKKLLSDKDLRCRMGAAGRKKVEKEFSLQVWGPKMALALRQIADEARKKQ
jgi:glycosyltransferase involved in cell wall biosynthesis